MDALTWNLLISQLPVPHVFQTREWGEVKAHFGWQPCYLLWVEMPGGQVELVPQLPAGGATVRAAALILKRTVGIRGLSTGLSMLYIPKGPLLYDWGDAALRQRVLEDIVAVAKRERAIFIKIDPDVPIATGLPGSDEEVNDLHGAVVLQDLKAQGWLYSGEQIQFANTVMIDLAQDEEQLLAGMKAKTRYNIRLAERKGVEIRQGGMADLDLLYRLYAETSVRDGFVIRSLDYYQTLWSTFIKAGMVRILIAEVEGEAIAALVLFLFQKKAWYLYGMSRDVHREKMPNYLLQWEAIRQCKLAGCLVYDLWGAPYHFEETDPLWGVYRFKEGLGGQVVRHIGAWDLPVQQENVSLVHTGFAQDTGWDAQARRCQDPETPLRAHLAREWSHYLMNKMPRVPIAQLPTPVEFLPSLTRMCGGAKIFVKRDDQTGLALGGNKARKLEYLMGEAIARGADMVITAGAVQSNHCRQTAAAAARCHLDCELVLLGSEPDQRTGNLLLDGLLGAKLRWTRKKSRDAELQNAFQEASAHGKKPYLIPYGGSNPVGATGYVDAMAELVSQWDAERMENPLPNWIILPSGSGGTQAGMVLGARKFRFPGRILGISVDEPANSFAPRIVRLVNETAALLGIDAQGCESDVLVSSDYLGKGYGVVGSAEVEAIQMFARSEGLLLDPVYTGRAAAGMIDLIRKRTITPHESVLFWHTGGAPALFASQYSDALSPL